MKGKPNYVTNNQDIITKGLRNILKLKTDQRSKELSYKIILKKIQLKDNFSSYEGMVTTLATAELSSPGSRYNEVKTLVEETKDEVTAAMQIVEAEDRGRGLYTLQGAPTLLLEYPKFLGRDTQC